MFDNINTLKNPSEFDHEDLALSPFATFEDEYIEEEKRYTMPTTITELDSALLAAVNKTLITTSALLKVQLENSGIHTEMPTLKYRLKRLTAAEFLIAYRFRTNNGGKSSNLIYRLGWRGAGYLKAQGIHANKTSYLATISSDPMSCKKILSAAQMAVRSNLPMGKMEFAQPVFVPSRDPSQKSTKIFRPQCVLQGLDRTIFFEAVRKGADWQEWMEEKLTRMEAVCKERQANIPIHNPAVVLIAESSDHMRQIAKCIQHNKKYPFEVLLTADPLVYERPQDCLYIIQPKKKSFWDMLLAG